MPQAVDPGYPCVRITWPPPAVPATEDLFRVHASGDYEKAEPSEDTWVKHLDPEVLGVYFVDSADPAHVLLFYEGPPRTVQERQGGKLVRTGSWGPCT